MRVALIGDSHAEIMFPYLQEKLIAEGHQVVFNLPKRGWSTYSFFDKGLLDQLRGPKPDAVIVSLGGNNHRTNSTQYKTAVERFLGEIGYPQSKVIWIGPFTSDSSKASDTAERHDWTASFLKSNLPTGVKFIDTRPISTTGHSGDGIHFNSSSYFTMVDEIFPDVLSGMKGTFGVIVRKVVPPTLILIALGWTTFVIWKMRERWR
jgi:hypothetical protein